jgi:hypothetical protein
VTIWQETSASLLTSATGIPHPARDAPRRHQQRRPVAAAAREGLLDLMRRAREGANHLI